MNTNAYDTVIAAAIRNLNPRARYARAVLIGWQRWSGADLKGLAKTRFGAAYAAQRDNAARALAAAGGAVIATAPHGRLVTAAPVEDGTYQDANGNLWRKQDGYKHYRRVSP